MISLNIVFVNKYKIVTGLLIDITVYWVTKLCAVFKKVFENYAEEPAKRAFNSARYLPASS